MAWTAPRTWTTAEIVTAAHMNEQVRDNELFLHSAIGSGKWIFAPAQDGGAGLQGADTDYPTIECLLSGDSAYMAFRAPADFTTITTAIIIAIPKATQAAANWDIFSDYHATGEDPQTHTESDAATTYDVTNDISFEVDVSGILSSLAADDWVGLRIECKNDAHDFECIGFYMTYS